ncbi:MAG TPA: hypothetical protein VGZ69_06990 [Candidatus Rhabdochlamydia sp.]|jgi:hypothetical protein|nr:hypothetical protein [Candidatus Rhabdochlamydia sp.]
MSIYLNNFLQFPNLTFWSRFNITGGGQSPVKLEIIETTDEIFKSTSSQTQSKSNNSGDFIEELSFLQNGAPIEEELKTPDALNYTYDFKINPRQIITNSCDNRQNSNNSTKEVSSLRRSERIAKYQLIKENSSNSIEAPSPKRRCLMPIKLPIGVKKNAFYHLSYNSAAKKPKVQSLRNKTSSPKTV